MMRSDDACNSPLPSTEPCIVPNLESLTIMILAISVWPIQSGGGIYNGEGATFNFKNNAAANFNVTSAVSDNSFVYT